MKLEEFSQDDFERASKRLVRSLTRGKTTLSQPKAILLGGQSGAGKTVLMRSLTGLLDPTKGEVLYDGRNFVNMTKKDQILMRREMGMIFQGAAPL